MRWGRLDTQTNERSAWPPRRRRHLPRLQTVRAAARYTYTEEGRKEEGGNDRANDGDNDEDDYDDDEAAHPERPSGWNVDWTEGDADGWRSRRRTRCHCAAGPRRPYTTPRHHTVYV